MTAGLVELLGIDEGDVVAFVGGGGKSTLTLGTGRELAIAGRPVVLATTTKMGVDQIPDWAEVCQETLAVHRALQDGKPCYLLKRAEDGKVIGADPGIIDEIAATTAATVFVEADGSRGRPFKAPNDREPVIPLSTTLAVVVVGGDAIGRPIGEVCHRPERVAALTGRSVEHLVRPSDIAAVVSHPDGGMRRVPRRARVVLALTKVTADMGFAVSEIEEKLAGHIGIAVIADITQQPDRRAP